MGTLVITVIGDDRAGLVSALADIIAEHSGSWGRSQLAELAGKFAGIVTVEVPDEQSEALVAALEPLKGVLETSVHTVADRRTAPDVEEQHQLELVGNDRPGIVKEISGVLSRHDVTIDELSTRTIPAPMTGGELFEASITLRPSAQTRLEAVRADLEELAGELMVDITLEGQDA